MSDRRCYMAALAALAVGAPALAQDQTQPEVRAPTPDATEAQLHADKPLLERDQLLGDWWGARTSLAEKGITFDIHFTQYAQGVLDGGRDEKWEYGGNIDVLLRADLGKADLVPGGFLRVRAESRFGDSVNGVSGSALPVNTQGFFPLSSPPNDDIPIALTELNYTQFLSEWFAVVVGKVQTLDGDPNEFASGRGRSQFMNSNFVFNAVLAQTIPYSTLGAGVVVIPHQNILITSMVMNSADSSTTSGFEDFGEGWTWSTEAQFQYALGELPGGMNVGFIYAGDSDFQQIGGRLGLLPRIDRDTEDDTWALYWSAWQYLFTLDERTGPINIIDGVPDLRGLGLFARLGIADQDTNPIEWSGSIGVGGRGIIPTRDRDTFGAGFIYTKLQDLGLPDFVGIETDAYGGEVFYNFSVTPAIDFTVDFQIVRPAFSNLDTATILGFRLDMRF